MLVRVRWFACAVWDPGIADLALVERPIPNLSLVRDTKEEGEEEEDEMVVVVVVAVVDGKEEDSCFVGNDRVEVVLRTTFPGPAASPRRNRKLKAFWDTELLFDEGGLLPSRCSIIAPPVTNKWPKWFSIQKKN